MPRDGKPQDRIDYDALQQDALRGVVRAALKQAATTGLPGDHHFYITFKTAAPGVSGPNELLGQYPDEMMIILQHQFWGLKVKDNHFEVTLSFKKIPATLVIPFAALTQFADPGVQFALQFRETDEDGGLKPLPAAPIQPSTEPVKLEHPAEAHHEPAEKPAAPGEVVSLDAFRKK